MKKIIFINSHPIQYFAPMYKYMNEQGLDVSAWYGSDVSVKGSIDNEFGVLVKWDIPLVEGYSHRFFKNMSWVPSHANGFWGLINLGMILEIFKIPKSVIIVHGWHYFTHFMIIMLGKLRGHTICLRNETPMSHEKLKTGWKQSLKRIGLNYILFPRINYFLYIGNQNRSFYKNFGIADSRLLRCPYAVDNDRFVNMQYDIESLKAELNIPKSHKVILSSAKYIDKKRPLDLLQAFKTLNNQNCWLLMVGEGRLRKEMEEFITLHKLKNVLLTGFINQSLITQYYAISDVFVMCSSLGETWGLSVNEAMNYNLPLILSDLTGCSDDLVIDGINGYKFKTGNVEELTQRLKNVLFDNKLSWSINSRDIIKNYSYDFIVKNIKTIL